MKRKFILFMVAVSLLKLTPALAEDTLFIEEMTWPEVAAAIRAGKQTAIIYAGSTEQNAPHMVLGKHNFMAHHLAEMIARKLGNALIYPVLPFAPTGDPLKRSGHMHFPGSVSLREETYGAVIQDEVFSALAAGFRNVLIMGDHGDGQDRLAAVAKELDSGTRPHGVRVLYIGAVYSKDAGAHAGREDTSMLMAIDSGARWVRKDHIKEAGPANGAEASPQGASAAEGRSLIDARVRDAVREIRELLSGAP